MAIVSPAMAELTVVPLNLDPNTSIVLDPPPLDPQTLALEVVHSASVTPLAGTNYARIRNVIQNGTQQSDNPANIGTFSDGNIPASPATPLPIQDPTLPGTEVYTGGIGIVSGVVLATGLLSDASAQLLDDPDDMPPTGRGVGIQGPNNGWDASTSAGSVGTYPGDVHREGASADLDYIEVMGGTAQSKDACAFEFEFQITQPGFLEIVLAFATDEWPAHVQLEGQNDSVGVLLQQVSPLAVAPYTQGLSTPSGWANIFQFRNRTSTSPLVVALTRFDLVLVDSMSGSSRAKLFTANRMAPKPDVPDDLDLSPSNPPGAVWYDHEFSGFTKRLRRQSGERVMGLKPIPMGATSYPARFRLKIVVQDQHDIVTSAAFIEGHSVRFRSIIPGDFNLDGNCDGSDFGIWNSNKFTSGKTFLEGDANFDGNVDGTDFGIWNSHKFTGGGYVYDAADCNNDSVVNATDQQIQAGFLGLTNLATRFEGDVDGDGDVDATDQTLLNAQIPPGP